MGLHQCQPWKPGHTLPSSKTHGNPGWHRASLTQLLAEVKPGRSRKMGQGSRRPCQTFMGVGLPSSFSSLNAFRSAGSASFLAVSGWLIYSIRIQRQLACPFIQASQQCEGLTKRIKAL